MVEPLSIRVIFPVTWWARTASFLRRTRGSMAKALAHLQSAALAALAIIAMPPHVPAQETKAATASASETEEERKERETRRACARAICSTLHNHKPATGDVACNVQKSWRKEVLTKIMERGKIAWSWGNARCMGDLRLDRATLIKSMTEPEFEAQFDKHDLRCELEGEKEKYEVKLQIHPKVTFKHGKAVKAKLNWGNIEAPRLAKTALWSATAADNSFGVLQGVLVDDINDFIQTRCMEVKEEWQGK